MKERTTRPKLGGYGQDWDHGTTTRTLRMNYLIYGLALSFIWVLVWFCLRSYCYSHPLPLRASPTYPIALTIVHLDGTSILSLHNINIIVRIASLFTRLFWLFLRTLFGLLSAKTLKYALPAKGIRLFRSQSQPCRQSLAFDFATFGCEASSLVQIDRTSTLSLL